MKTRALTLTGAALLGVACTKAVVPERPERPPGDAGGNAPVTAALSVAPLDAAPPRIAPAPAPAVTAVTADKASAWTDEIVVRELANDCAWAPKLPKEEDAQLDWQSDAKVSPLSCDMHFAQSCAPDRCYASLVSECGPTCAKACDSCGGRCATKCTACKKDCADEACKLACARSCGQCHEECVKEADRCRSGKCAAENAACYKREYEKFKRMGCEKPCDAMATCYMECMSSPTATATPCMATCGAKMGKCAKDYDYGCAVGWRPPPP